MPDTPLQHGDMLQFWLGTAIFIATYVGIGLEKKLRINKTSIALLGSSLMLMTILVPVGHGTHAPDAAGSAVVAHDAASSTAALYEKLNSYSKYVDFNVIFLLAGMMVIVNVLRKTGVFEYLAIKSAKLARGHALVAQILLVIVTAVLSAFLDNVTTVLLIMPVTLLVAEQLSIDPIAFIIPEVIASNIGGTATLIGDPPNILIGSYAGLDFLAFLLYMTPVVVVTMCIFVGGLYLVFRGKLEVTVEQRARVMEINERRAIRDAKLLRNSLIVLTLTMIGFLTHGLLGLEPGVVAMGGAALLLVITRQDVEKALEQVEWVTLFFFLGLFVVVSGAERAGLINVLAEWMKAGVDGSPVRAALLLLWGSALCVGVMNNVSFTAAALPIAASTAASLGFNDISDSAPLWWALALGACLGGNLTPVGAAANVIAYDFCAKNRCAFSFGKFMKWSVPITIVGLLIASVWVVLLIKY